MYCCTEMLIMRICIYVYQLALYIYVYMRIYIYICTCIYYMHVDDYTKYHIGPLYMCCSAVYICMHVATYVRVYTYSTCIHNCFHLLHHRCDAL